jgi:hypothetical protein
VAHLPRLSRLDVVVVVAPHALVRYLQSLPIHSPLTSTSIPTSRMLKKSASFVLASLRSSTYRMRFSEVEALKGLFRSPRTIAKANGPHEVRLVPLHLFASLLAAALLNSLFEHPAGSISLLRHMCEPSKFSRATPVFPHPARAIRPHMATSQFFSPFDSSAPS